MSQYYTEFSFLVDCPNAQAAVRLAAMLQCYNLDQELLDAHDLEEGDCIASTEISENTKVYVFCQESTNLEALADILQKYLKERDTERVIDFQYAISCSQPISTELNNKFRSEFGRGSVVITAQERFKMRVSMEVIA